MADIPSEHIQGEDKGDIRFYGLSTCIWCKKTRELLNKLGVDYYKVEVDLLEKADKDMAMDEVRKHNPDCSFPTLVINNDQCIVGYDESAIKRALG